MIALDARPSATSQEYLRFLSERFQRVKGEKAAPGHRGRYAVVRQGREVLGLVAVDAELGIWYTPHAEDQAELVHQGFSYSRGNLLAALYHDLPFATFAPRRAATAPSPVAAAPTSPPRMPRRGQPILAGAGPRTGERQEERALEEIDVALGSSGLIPAHLLAWKPSTGDQPAV